MYAVTQIVNHVSEGLNKRAKTVALFIDFKKAFDSLQYDVLMTKLETSNLHKSTADWIKSYLSNREQRVKANSTLSEYDTTTQGVPQGSILGPLFYIIYANDLVNTIQGSKVALYADDTVIYTTSKNISNALQQIQGDLNNLGDWCTQNGIHINENKTKYVIFGNQINTASTSGNQPLRLLYKGKEIERVTNYCYLGIKLDEKFSFDQHAQQTLNKAAEKIGHLKKLRKSLNQNAALMIYKNMILPIMEYGDIYMHSSTKEYRKKLQTLQNGALRCALNRDARSDTTELHKTANLQKLKQRRKTHLLQHMYQISKFQNFRGWKKRSSGVLTRSSSKK